MRADRVGTQSSLPWRMVDNNVTVTREPALLGTCDAIASSCVSGDDLSITAELVEYQSTYYIHNVTVSVGGVVTMTTTFSNGSTSEAVLNQGSATTVYTAWFTNSTLFCVSPQWNEAMMACPAR